MSYTSVSCLMAVANLNRFNQLKKGYGVNFWLAFVSP
jgi:hypothetical protein